MKRANGRYRSYKEKKSQSKIFRSYLLRVLIVLFLFSVFTSFIALAISVNTESMNPNLEMGDRLVFSPSKNISTIFGRDINKGLKRGDLVITGTSYSVDASIWDIILDPVVRVFTLQKKSLLYDNSDYRGRSELLRVVGLPGDTIRIKDYTVYIKPSGEEYFLNEFELTDRDYDLLKPDLHSDWKDEYPFSSRHEDIYIGENELFLISDNRAYLNDSRVFGPVSSENIRGRVVFKYWPLNKFEIY